MNNIPCKESEILNKKFGKLKPIRKILAPYPNKGLRTRYECLCDCGNKTLVFPTHLISGDTKSCGCLKRLLSNRNKDWKGYGEISAQYWTSIKRHAKERNIEFKINIEQAWDLFLIQNKKCVILGVEINFKNSNNIKQKQTASLDRIDSSKGYTIDNIQWVHKKINIFKMSLNNKDFIQLCHEISDFQRSKSSIDLT